MESTLKLATKVTVAENEICKFKMQHEKATIQSSRCSKCCSLSRTRVLGLGSR